jgi:hypothetical protein
MAPALRGWHPCAQDEMTQSSERMHVGLCACVWSCAQCLRLSVRMHVGLCACVSAERTCGLSPCISGWVERVRVGLLLAACMTCFGCAHSCAINARDSAIHSMLLVPVCILELERTSRVACTQLLPCMAAIDESLFVKHSYGWSLQSCVATVINEPFI